MYYYFYKITNNINGKYYYGVHHTENINDGYMGSGVLLWRAYNKYGQSNFTKEIIRYFDNADDMFKYEAEIVNEDLVKDVNCYNIALGGFGGNLIAGLSEEEKNKWRNKLSESGKESYKNNPDRAKQHSNKMKEYYSIQENKDKLREIMKPIVTSEEYRDKMSKSTSGEKNGMFGYKWSEEQNRKRSETMKEVYKDPIHKQNLMNAIYKRGDEWRKHISESRKGIKLSDEHKRAISEGNKGHVVSDETRKKLSLANKGKKRPKISEALRGKPSGTSGKHWKLDQITNKRIYY